MRWPGRNDFRLVLCHIRQVQARGGRALSPPPASTAQQAGTQASSPGSTDRAMGRVRTKGSKTLLSQHSESGSQRLCIPAGAPETGPSTLRDAISTLQEREAKIGYIRVALDNLLGQHPAWHPQRPLCQLSQPNCRPTVGVCPPALGRVTDKAFLLYQINPVFPFVKLTSRGSHHEREEMSREVPPYSPALLCACSACCDPGESPSSYPVPPTCLVEPPGFSQC